MPKSSKKPVEVVSKALSSSSYQKLLAILRKEIARGQECINTYIDIGLECSRFTKEKF